MATATAPIKVDAATDDLVSHAAHFKSRSKKDIVDAAVREYIHAHRDEIIAGMKAALGQLNGTDAAAVSLATALSAEDLGGGEEAFDLASDSWLRTEAASAYDALKANPSQAIPVESVRAGFEAKWAARL